jgi:hypothetical protein
MALVFDTLTLPDKATPLAHRTVKVRTPVSVSIEDEQREVMLESDLRTDVDGLFVADLDPLPESYYYLLVYPGNDIRTIIVPTVDPPQDAEHLVPNSSPPAYGYWASELREDNPSQPSPVVIGVRQLLAGVGITIDSSDPRRPRITAVIPSAADVGADPAGAADAARQAAITAAAADASSKASSAQSAATSAAHTDAAAQITALNLGSAATHPASDFATPAAITSAITALIGGAPGALDTLKELADALGDDAAFASHVTNSLATITAQLITKVSAPTDGSARPTCAVMAPGRLRPAAAARRWQES